MELIKFASIIVCVAGLVMYLMILNPKANEVGRIMFAFGLLGNAIKVMRLLPFPSPLQYVPRTRGLPVSYSPAFSKQPQPIMLD